MNKLYGLLVDKPDSGELYYRNTTQTAESTPATRVLLPSTDDKAYQQFCADQLSRLCFDVFPDQLRALDPDNTYAYLAAPLVAKDTVSYGLPAGVSVVVFDQLIGYPFVMKTVSFTYDGVTFVFDNKQLPWNNGTGTFQYQGFNIAFTGVAPGVFQGTLEFTRHPERSLLSLWSAIDSYGETVWDPEYEPYRDSTLLTQRVAAFTLNTLKGIVG